MPIFIRRIRGGDIVAASEMPGSPGSAVIPLSVGCEIDAATVGCQNALLHWSGRLFPTAQAASIGTGGKASRDVDVLGGTVHVLAQPDGACHVGGIRHRYARAGLAV